MFVQVNFKLLAIFHVPHSSCPTFRSGVRTWLSGKLADPGKLGLGFEPHCCRMFNYYDVIIFNLVVCNVRFTLSLLLLIGLALEKAVFMIYCILK